MSNRFELISNFKLPNKPFYGKKIEADFTMWFARHIKDNGGHRHKLSDMDIRKKPYDAIMTYKGLDAKIELKQSDNKKSVDLFKMLLPHQVKGLQENQENGGLSLVIYYNTFHHKYRVKEFSKDLLISVE